MSDNFKRIQSGSFTIVSDKDERSELKYTFIAVDIKPGIKGNPEIDYFVTTSHTYKGTTKDVRTINGHKSVTEPEVSQTGGFFAITAASDEDFKSQLIQTYHQNYYGIDVDIEHLIDSDSFKAEMFEPYGVKKPLRPVTSSSLASVKFSESVALFAFKNIQPMLWKNVTRAKMWPNHDTKSMEIDLFQFKHYVSLADKKDKSFESDLNENLKEMYLAYNKNITKLSKLGINYGTIFEIILGFEWWSDAMAGDDMYSAFIGLIDYDQQSTDAETNELDSIARISNLKDIAALMTPKFGGSRLIDLYFAEHITTEPERVVHGELLRMAESLNEPHSLTFRVSNGGDQYHIGKTDLIV